MVVIYKKAFLNNEAASKHYISIYISRRQGLIRIYGEYVPSTIGGFYILECFLLKYVTLPSLTSSHFDFFNAFFQVHM